VKLTPFERLTLLNILPPEGDLSAIKIQRQLRESLSFSEAEHAKLGIQFGMDWSAGCPRCGSKDIEYPGEQMRLSPERKCNTCKFEGMHGPGQVFWNQKVTIEKDVKVGKKAYEIVAGVLQKLVDEKKLREQHWSLCEKFGLVEDDGEEEAT